MRSRVMSLVEAAANVLMGYGVAVVTQMIVFPWFGLRTTLGQNLQMEFDLYRGVAITELRAAAAVQHGATGQPPRKESTVSVRRQAPAQSQEPRPERGTVLN